MTSMFQINVSAFLCFLPVIAVIYLYVLSANGVSSSLPFTSFVGAGYPSVVDASAKAFDLTQKLFMRFGVFFLPLAIFVSTYLSQTVQYAMRNFVWTEGHFSFKTLFKAFKFNWKQPIFISLLTAVFSMGVMFLVYLFRNYLYVNGWNVWAVLIVIGLALVSLFFVIVTMYAYSISITYREGIFAVYRDAVVLTVRLIVTNLFITLAVLLPIGLLFALMNTAFASIVLMVIIFIGFAYMLLTWTVYSQYVFDLATNKLKGDNPYAKQDKKL